MKRTTSVLAAIAVLAFASCSGSSGPTAPNQKPAPNLAGTWNALFDMTNCENWRGQVVVAQTGNVFTFEIPAQNATIVGTISSGPAQTTAGPAVAFDVTVCGVHASGSGVAGSSLIDSDFSAPAPTLTWTCVCQYASKPSGVFSLTR